MGNFCEKPQDSDRSHLDEFHRVQEAQRLYESKQQVKASNMSVGSETTKSRGTDLSRRKKTRKMGQPTRKIFTIRRPEFSVAVFDALLSDKYKDLPAYGAILLEDNSTYTGQMKNKLRYGFGELVAADGSMYEGYWDNDKRNGAGRLFFANGQVYDGFWANDQMQGYGRLYVSELEYYEGSFEDGKKSGLGKHYLPDGSYFEGTWIQNSKVGEGWFFSASDKTRTLQRWTFDSTQN